MLSSAFWDPDLAHLHRSNFSFDTFNFSGSFLWNIWSCHLPLRFICTCQAMQNGGRMGFFSSHLLKNDQTIYTQLKFLEFLVWFFTSVLQHVGLKTLKTHDGAQISTIPRSWLGDHCHCDSGFQCQRQCFHWRIEFAAELRMDSAAKPARPTESNGTNETNETNATDATLQDFQDFASDTFDGSRLFLVDLLGWQSLVESWSLYRFGRLAQVVFTTATWSPAILAFLEDVWKPDFLKSNVTPWHPLISFDFVGPRHRGFERKALDRDRKRLRPCSKYFRWFRSMCRR